MYCRFFILQYKFYGMKSLLIGLSVILSCDNAIAQTDTTYEYLDNDQHICPPSKAVFIAKSFPENNKFTRQLFDKRGERILGIGYYTDAACKNAEGLFTHYFYTGGLLEEGTFHHNKKTGTWKGWHDNGKPQFVFAYTDNGVLNGINLSWSEDGRVTDSILLDDKGNGFAKSWWPDGKLSGEGPYINGMKEGKWTYYYHDHPFKSEEVIYKSDTFSSCTCYDETGKLQKSNCGFEVEAECKEWINYLNQQLSSAKFPQKYYKGKVWGVTMISFSVGTDGKTTDIKVMRSTDPDMDKIAVNIIKNSPPWKPAIQYNRKVKAYRTQPFVFSRVTD